MSYEVFVTFIVDAKHLDDERTTDEVLSPAWKAVKRLVHHYIADADQLAVKITLTGRKNIELSHG
jgi:hypothetical protein